MPPRIAVRDISFFERPIPFAKPFRFGSVVITSSVQVFVRVEDRDRRQGYFDRRGRRIDGAEMVRQARALSPEQTVDGVRRALVIARELYLARRTSTPRSVTTPPCHGAGRKPAHARAFRRSPRPSARRRSTRRSWMRCCARYGRDFLRRPGAEYRGPRRAAHARYRRRRHRAIPAKPQSAGAGHGAAYRRHGRSGRRAFPPSTPSRRRYFKLKLSGDPGADAARLIRIGDELAMRPHRLPRHARRQRAICQSRCAWRAGRAC